MRQMILMGGALLVASCIPKQGRLETNRFQSEAYPYAVFYAADGKPMSPLGPNWRVDNFTEFSTSDGQQTGVAVDPKTGDAYVVTRGYDTNDDGTVDLEQREPFYDLLLEHNQKDAATWVRMVPISVHEQNKDLRVFAERYVEAVAGTGTIAARFGTEGATASIARSFASRILGGKECLASKRAAYRVDFEVANVEQLQLSDQARWSRGSLVIVRTGYTTRVGASDGGSVDYPVLMLIGLSASPRDYEELAPDFDRLLESTVLGEPHGGLAMHAETTCTAGSVPAAVTAPATPVPSSPTSGGEQASSPEQLLQPMPAEDAVEASGSPPTRP